MKHLRITVKEAAIARGITKAYRLQCLTGLVPSVAARVWKGKLRRIDLDVLAKVLDALNCEVADIITVEDVEPEVAAPAPLPEEVQAFAPIPVVVLPEPIITDNLRPEPVRVILEEDEEENMLDDSVYDNQEKLQ